jgi:hypothetical protein
MWLMVHFGCPIRCYFLYFHMRYRFTIPLEKRGEGGAAPSLYMKWFPLFLQGVCCTYLNLQFFVSCYWIYTLPSAATMSRCMEAISAIPCFHSLYLTIAKPNLTSSIHAELYFMMMYSNTTHPYTSAHGSPRFR